MVQDDDINFWSKRKKTNFLIIISSYLFIGFFFNIYKLYICIFSLSHYMSIKSMESGHSLDPKFNSTSKQFVHLKFELIFKEISQKYD
jgi:hypothetical protein